MSTSNVQIAQLPLSYVNNLQVAWASATTLTVAAGQARDSTNAFDIALTTGVTINAAVTGVNGLDAGALANSTYYYVHLIGSSQNLKQPACLLSTSQTAPTLPTGYDIFRRLGTVLTSGAAAILKFFAFGNGTTRTIMYDVTITELTASGSATYVAVDLTTSVPPVSQLAYLNFVFTPATASNTAKLRPTGSTSTTNLIITGSVASQNSGGQFLMNLSAAQSLDYITSSGSDALSLFTEGYIDYI